jgi:hypothetical protein
MAKHSYCKSGLIRAAIFYWQAIRREGQAFGNLPGKPI